MYKTLNEHYKQKFGCKVYKLSINGGFSCPNRDGSKSTGGCIFCSAQGGGEFAAPKQENIAKQLIEAKKRVSAKNKSGKYIAYFQAFSNTYADVSVLKPLYLAAIEPEYIVGISIATRPDCINSDILELLIDINKIKPVTIELGLQTSNEKTAKYINRCYDNAEYVNAVTALKQNGIEVVTHIIFGLPFESREDMLNTTRFAVLNKTDGVKFHLLYVLSGTKLETEYNLGNIKTLELEEYASILKEAISLLPSDTVVHRITGDGDKKSLIAPLWSADKKKVLNYLNNYLK